MQGTHAWQRTGFIAALTILPFLLGACLSKETAKSFNGDVENHVVGSVGDGPVAGASMEILAGDGSVLEEFVSDSYADYDALVKTKGENYPLTIEARNGTDLVTNLAPELTLTGCIANPGNNTRVNVNLFSTLALEIARDMPGGITKSNCVSAEKSAVAIFNAGLSSLKSTGPSSVKIDSSNVAEIVKASETLSEIVKRTRDYRQMFGASTSANQVLGQLGSDALDGVIDGRGGSQVDPRTAAISSIATVQAYLEAANNELHVNGADATDAMNGAISTVSDGSVLTTVGDQTVTAEMLTAIDIGMSAAYEVVQTQKVLDLWRATSGMQAGMEGTFVQTLLPDDYIATLDDVLMTVAGGSTATVNTVNDVVRAGGNDLPSTSPPTTPPTNTPPTISGNPPASVDAGNQYSFTPSASDADNDTLTFSVSGMPGWANFNQGTGRLFGTPADTDAGTYSNISITVSDGQDSATLGPFSITVNAAAPPPPPANTPPTISGNPPASVDAGNQYSFTPSASDADNDTLTFSVSGMPGWANFNQGTGRLFGTPADTDAGTYSNISITVSDGQDSATLGPFSITVNAAAPPPPPANTPPTISGNPPGQVNANSQYSFTPSASDADNDTLTFSISGMPGWANFNQGTGRLFGTPGDADVGTYSNISITVSDGQDSATLGPFSITVQAISLGAVTLSWTPPTQNEDGSPLTDLAGYKIYWGTTPGVYPNSVTLNNPGLTSYVVDNLVPGTYEFVATSVNSAGLESKYSTPATRTVN